MSPAQITMLVAFVLGAAAGILLFSLFGTHRRKLDQLQELRARESAETAKAMARLRRELDAYENRTREQVEVFQMLPHLLRDMFDAHGRRSLGPIALKLIDQLFHPDQAAIFMARLAQRRLALAAGKGLPGSLAPGTELEFGQGRIGYVAENRIVMDESDFKAAHGEKFVRSSSVQKALEVSGHKDLRADVVAPILEGDQLVGVLAMGGVKTRVGQEKHLLAMVAEVTAIALAHVARLRKVEETSDLDGLTGVANKAYFDSRLRDEVKKADRDRTEFSVVLLDVDHFRRYNDDSGHADGDDVLRKIGQILKGSIRDHDLAARYGGETFAVLYAGTPKDVGLRLAEGLRRAIEAYPFPNKARQPGGLLTVSGGVAGYPQDSREAPGLARAAHQALYDAKANGRNRIVAAVAGYLT